MFWFFGCKACGILAPRPGITPPALGTSPPALEGKVLTTGLPGKSLKNILKYKEKAFSRINIFYVITSQIIVKYHG